MVKKILLLLGFSVSFTITFSQTIFDSLLTQLNNKYPQETIYMQLDKTFYNSGETIWYKAYLKEGDFAARISTTLFAELLSEDGKILQKKIIPILESGAASHFELPAEIPSAKLYIRAYTSWMLNFDSSLFYVKPVNILKKETAKKTSDAGKYTLTLFPEGGDLAVGIESLVAFKTNDQEGKPFPVKGTIINGQGKTVSGFTSIHNGMGTFALTPLPGENYKASWKDPSGKQQETALPVARAAAATLSVTNKNGLLSYTVRRAADADFTMQEFFVVAQMHQETVYAASINLRSKTAATASIPTDSIYSGIIQITLFNKQNKPVAERISFINNNDYSFITDLHLVEKNIKAKGKNVLQVDVGGQLRSNLSISVTDADMDFRQPDEENIYSQMLLTSDIKGSVYHPAYYFSNDTDSLKQQLELVMMTNGWRRFNWDKLLAGKWPEIKYQPENYLSIKGNVFGLMPMQLRDRMITAFLQTTSRSEKTLLTLPIEKDGSFKFDGVYFFDTAKIFYQINNDKNKRLTDAASFSFKTNVSNSAGPSTTNPNLLPYSPQPPAAIVLKSIERNELLKEVDKQKVKLLETVVVKTKVRSKEDIANEEYTSMQFTSPMARTFLTEGDPFAKSAITVLDYLRSKMGNLQINTGGFGGEPSISRRGESVPVFLNEMNTTLDVIQSTPMSSVAMIKVFDPPFFGASNGSGGAVAIYTKKGEALTSDMKGLNIASLQGYSAIKEFYSPDYVADPVGYDDYRTTLFWQPFIIMNAQNKRVTIPFFNSDNTKRFRVIIEGINEQGKLTREEKIFE